MVKESEKRPVEIVFKQSSGALVALIWLVESSNVNMKCHVPNICTILSQQIMCGKLLLILIWTHHLNYYFSLVFFNKSSGALVAII